MSAFRCPVCDNNIGFLRKCRHSIWGEDNIECSSCGSRLRIKKYGSNIANVRFIVCIAYFFLGIKKFLFPVCFVGVEVFSFLKKLLSPLQVYNPKRKAGIIELIIAIVTTGVLVWLCFDSIFT